MPDIAIRVEHLAKRYRIGRNIGSLDGKNRVMYWVGAPFRFLANSLRKPGDNQTIWALKDVSFEVERGEVLGVIGRNGAGKSTLLKILSRITEPTSGKAVIWGRVGSLLEVGTGFHHELTGRENIYLNGAILGMKKFEIDRKFDEIVDFAGVETFIDTPVKRYSSGMYVRLAFAVAAHLEPEILLVDEVLAVGDVEFQRKCIGKMNNIAGEGRTILFVSHNMASVRHLCQRGILIADGKIEAIDQIDGIVDQYYKTFVSPIDSSFENIRDRQGDRRIEFTGLRLKDENGRILDSVTSGGNVSFELVFKTNGRNKYKNVIMSMAFFNLYGQSLFLCRSDYKNIYYQELTGRGFVVCTVPKFPLPPGNYYVNLYCEINGVISDWIKNSISLLVVAGDFYGSGRLPPRSRDDVLIEHDWSEDYFRGE